MRLIFTIVDGCGRWMLTRIGSLKLHFLFMFELLPFRILFEILPLLLSTVRIGGPTSIKEPTISNCMTEKEDHHATNGRREIDEEEEQEEEDETGAGSGSVAVIMAADAATSLP